MLYLAVSMLTVLAALLAGFFWLVREDSPNRTVPAVEDRRRGPRLAMNLYAELRPLMGPAPEDGAEPRPTLLTVKGHTRDVSQHGLFLQSDARLAVGTACRVAVYLTTDAREDIRVEVSGRVVRHEDEGMGVEFTVMSRESYELLSDLVAVHRNQHLRSGHAPAA